MNYLGHPQAALEAARGIWTAREISQQPAVWAQIDAAMAGGANATQDFLAPLLARRDLRIVLTGAGTSSFVGECLAGPMRRTTPPMRNPLPADFPHMLTRIDFGLRCGELEI